MHHSENATTLSPSMHHMANATIVAATNVKLMGVAKISPHMVFVVGEHCRGVGNWGKSPKMRENDVGGQEKSGKIREK